MNTTIRTAIALTASLVLVACVETPQEMSAQTKGSSPAWQGTGTAFVADGWKPGDQGSWDEQMRRRAQGQNEYVRIGGTN